MRLRRPATKTAKQEEEAEQPLLSPKADKADKRLDIKVTAGPVCDTSCRPVPAAGTARFCHVHVLRCSIV